MLPRHRFTAAFPLSLVDGGGMTWSGFQGVWVVFISPEQFVPLMFMWGVEELVGFATVTTD
jgi:hypothetical protein